MLGGREHSEAELRTKLVRRYPGLTQSHLDELIEELQALNLLSDVRFTETLIRSRIAKGYGPYYIARELAAKGVSKSLAQEHLERMDTDWFELAQSLVERRHPGASLVEADWSKAIRFLQRRGFAGQVISAAVGDRPLHSPVD